MVENTEEEDELYQIIVALFALCNECGNEFTKQGAHKILEDRGYSMTVMTEQ